MSGHPSTPTGQPLAGGSDDFGKAFGGFQSGELGWRQPVRFGELLVERNVAGDPARGKGQNDKMPFDLAVRRRA